MPLRPHVHQLIELPISNLRPGIMRKARFLRLLHEQAETGECSAVIQVVITLYDALPGGGYGARLQSGSLIPYEIPLNANNGKLVDATTGAILAIFNTWDTPAQRTAIVNGFAQETAYQGDFFELVRDNAPIVIGNLIRQHIQQADQMGLFT